MPCKEARINSTKQRFLWERWKVAIKAMVGPKWSRGSDGKMYWEPADMWKATLPVATCIWPPPTSTSTGPGTQAPADSAEWQLQHCKKWAYPYIYNGLRWHALINWKSNVMKDVFKIQGNHQPIHRLLTWWNMYGATASTMLSILPRPWRQQSTRAELVEKVVGGTIDPTPNRKSLWYKTLMNKDFTKSKRWLHGNYQQKRKWLQEYMDADFTIWFGRLQHYTASTKKNHAPDALLSTPEIDLTEYNNATLTINQAVNSSKVKGHAIPVNRSIGYQPGNRRNWDIITPRWFHWYHKKIRGSLMIIISICHSIVEASYNSVSATPAWNHLLQPGNQEMSVKGTKPVGNRHQPDTDINFYRYRLQSAISGIHHWWKDPSLSNGYKGILIIKQGKNAKKIVKPLSPSCIAWYKMGLFFMI